MPYVLLLLLVLAACSPPPEPAAPDRSPTARAETKEGDAPTTPAPPAAEPTPRTMPSPTDPPILTTFRTGDGAIASLTFRTVEGAAISEHEPLVLVVRGDTLEAPLTAGPARFSDPDGTIVDQASYRLDARIFRALVNARTDAVTVYVSHDNGYYSYPYLSGDTIE